MLPDGYDMERLENQIKRIMKVRDMAEDGLPDTPRTKVERQFRNKTQVGLLTLAALVLCLYSFSLSGSLEI